LLALRAETCDLLLDQKSLELNFHHLAKCKEKRLFCSIGDFHVCGLLFHHDLCAGMCILKTRQMKSRLKKSMRFSTLITLLGCALFLAACKKRAPVPDPFHMQINGVNLVIPKEYIESGLGIDARETHVVGDLGGVPVTIPRHFANYVEYEDDPSWGEKRHGAKPKRTHQSKLESFGYYTRFPDMAGESSEELIKNRGSYSKATTPWISVGINTGSRYPGNGFLERLTNATVETPNTILKYMNYEELPIKEHGITAYAAVGIDPKTNKPYREDADAKDVWVSRDKFGRVDAYIQCSNRKVPAPPCTHIFSLERNMDAEIYLSYSRNQLPQWQEIQEAVKQQILSFRIQATETVSPKSQKTH
jgi:hypothetical protein